MPRSEIKLTWVGVSNVLEIRQFNAAATRLSHIRKIRSESRPSLQLCSQAFFLVLSLSRKCQHLEQVVTTSVSFCLKFYVRLLLGRLFLISSLAFTIHSKVYTFLYFLGRYWSDCGVKHFDSV